MAVFEVFRAWECYLVLVPGVGSAQLAQSQKPHIFVVGAVGAASCRRAPFSGLCLGGASGAAANIVPVGAEAGI